MKRPYFVRTIILAGSLLLQLGTFCFQSRSAPGDVDLSFDPGSGVNGTVQAVAVQPDGKVIIGGEFTTVKGLVRKNLARLNADGSGDSSFTLGFPLMNPVYALALQPDGKVLVGGGFDNFGLIRLNSDGSPDTNFNANAFLAIASTEPYYPIPVSTIVVQPDGKILFAGESLLRLNFNGTLDNSFSAGMQAYVYSMALQSDGKVIIHGYFNGGGYGLARLHANGSLDGTFNAPAGNDALFYSIVLQPDSKVLIGGSPFWVNETNLTSVARLNSDGSVDATFNQGGTGAGSTYIHCMALQPDAKVIIGGQFVSINGHSRTNLARLNADGSVDTSFQNGTGGVSGEGALYFGTSVRAIALQPDGTMLIGGAFATVNGTSRNRMARLNADGSLDAAFRPGQGVDPTSSLVVQPDGKVLIGGALTFINGTNCYASARLNADGSRDETFIAATNFNPDLLAVRRDDDCLAGNYNCQLHAGASTVAVQADGKVLIGGTVRTEVTGEEVWLFFYRSILGRFYADGSLDANFAPVFEGGNYDQFQGAGKVIVQPDGKIIVGGTFSSVNGTNRNGLARLNGDGTLDNSFVPGTGHYASIGSLALQPDGRILISGSFGLVNGTNYSGIARLNANGSWDGSFVPGTGANGVGSLVLQPDGKIILGGYFSSINGTNGYGIARFHENGSLDNTFNPATAEGGFVGPIELQSNGDVLIGGSFLAINGVVRPHVARLYGDFATSSPSLSIARSSGFAIISWPATALNLQLQENTNFSLPNSWSPVPQAAVTNADQISVTVPTTVGGKFFRLKSQ